MYVPEIVTANSIWESRIFTRVGPGLDGLIPARSLRRTGIGLVQRVQAAWGVLSGRYDALNWEESHGLEAGIAPLSGVSEPSQPEPAPAGSVHAVLQQNVQAEPEWESSPRPGQPEMGKGASRQADGDGRPLSPQG